MEHKTYTYDEVFKYLMKEGCVGIVWCIEANEPFDEDKFLSFKYGYLLADNEDALVNNLPHRHNLLDLYRSLKGRLDNDFVDFGKHVFCVYGSPTDSYWDKHCSTCNYYDTVENQMYCCYLKKGITARKKACKKYIPIPVQAYLKKYYEREL